MNKIMFQFKLYVDKGRVINGGDSIFEVNSLIPLPHDATPAAKKRGSANNSLTIRFRKILVPEMELACENSNYKYL